MSSPESLGRRGRGHPGLSGAMVPVSPAPSPIPSVRVAKGDHVPLGADVLSSAMSVQRVVQAYADMDDAQRMLLLKELLGMSSREVLVETTNYVEPMIRHDPFRILPTEISLRILAYITDPQSLAAASQVSKLWYLLLSDDSTWKRLCSAHHYRRLSAAGSAHPRRAYLGNVQEHSNVTATLKNLEDMVFDPSAVETAAPTSYRTHFRQQYLLNSAWQSGGRIAARYVLRNSEEVIVTTVLMRGDYIVVALNNSRILVFALNGRLLSSLFGHVMGVWALALWGNTLVSGGCDRDIRVWDLKNGVCTRILRGHSSTVRCLAMASSRIALSGARDSNIRVWDLEAGTCLHVLEGHKLTVRALHAEGDLCVSASYDGTARVWNIETGELVHILNGHEAAIHSLAVEGDTVATGSVDMHIRIWSLRTGLCTAVLSGHLSLIGSLQLKGATLVSGSYDSSIRVWDLHTNRCVHRIAAHDKAVSCLQFDGERIVSGGPDGQIHVWSVDNGHLIRTLGYQFENIWGFSMSEDRLVFAAAALRLHNTVIELISFVPQ